MPPVTDEFKRAHAFVDSKETEDSRLLCDLFVERGQNKTVTISLQVFMPYHDAGSGETLVLSWEPPHLHKNSKLQFPESGQTNKKSNKKADRKNDKATLSLVLKKDHNCVIWRSSSKRRVQDDIFKPGPRYSQFINIVQANTVHVVFSPNNGKKSLYDLESVITNLSRWRGYRASYGFKHKERWNKPVFLRKENNKCDTQHLPNIELPTQSAASLTHLLEVSVPETDHSGSPDKKNEQHSVPVPGSQRSVLTNSETDHSNSPNEKNEQHSVLVPDSQCSIPADSAPGSPSSFRYVPDSMRSPGSPSPMPTVSQIYRREELRRPIFRPQYTEGLLFGGKGPSPEPDPIGSPTRNLPASPATSGPTPLGSDENLLQPPVPGSPTIPSSTGNSCSSVLGAEQLTSFVPSKTLELIEHLVTKTVAVHERKMEELKAEWSRSLSDTVKRLVEQHFKDLLDGKDRDLGRVTDIGTAKSKELDDEKCLEERTQRLNKRKRELDERRLDSIERR